MATTRKLRGRSRGAALVEALVAIPFFIAIFIGLVFFNKLYLEKLRTVADARQRAWTLAIANCKDGDKTGTETNPEPIGSESGSDLGQDGKYADGFKGSDTASKGSSSITVTVNGKVTSNQRTDYNQTSGYTEVTKNFTSKASVTCNEEPVDGDDWGGAINKAFSYFSP